MYPVKPGPMIINLTGENIPEFTEFISCPQISHSIRSGQTQLVKPYRYLFCAWQIGCIE